MTACAIARPHTLSAAIVGNNVGSPETRCIKSAIPDAAWMMSSYAGAFSSGEPRGHPCAWQYTTSGAMALTDS